MYPASTLLPCQINTKLARGELFYPVSGFGSQHFVLARSESAAIGIFCRLLEIPRDHTDKVAIAGDAQQLVPQYFVVFGGRKKGRPIAKIIAA